MVKKHRVHLSVERQEELRGLVSKVREAAYRQTHARILLLCDGNQDGGAMLDADIARALKVGTATVERVRRRRVEEASGIKVKVIPGDSISAEAPPPTWTHTFSGSRPRTNRPAQPVGSAAEAQQWVKWRGHHQKGEMK